MNIAIREFRTAMPLCLEKPAPYGGVWTDRAPAKSFQDLIAWKKSHQFVLSIYQATEAFPRAEFYGLTAQLRRAAISVPANIAEGFKRRTGTDKVRFLNIAQASLEECRYYLILAEDLGYGKFQHMGLLAEEVSKLLTAYCRGILSPRTGLLTSDS